MNYLIVCFLNMIIPRGGRDYKLMNPTFSKLSLLFFLCADFFSVILCTVTDVAPYRQN